MNFIMKGADGAEDWSLMGWQYRYFAVICSIPFPPHRFLHLCTGYSVHSIVKIINFSNRIYSALMLLVSHYVQYLTSPTDDYHI